MAEDARPKAAEGPLVSAIVCTYNRAQRLERCLRALGRQRPLPGGLEILVVDDGSTDETPQLCRRLAEELPNLRYVSCGVNKGLGTGRNVGMRAARGKLLLYTDDDCIAQEDWALRMSEALCREPMVAGAVATAPGGYVQLCHNVAHFYGYMPCHAAGPSYSMAGANMGFRRGDLERLGGFSEGMRCAEDMEIALRARERGYQLCFCPQAVVLHDPGRSSWRVIFRYAMRHAATTVHLRNRHRALLRTPWLMRSPGLLVAASPAIALVVTLRIFLSSGMLARRFYTAPVVYGLKVAWCIGAARGLRNPPEVYQKA